MKSSTFRNDILRLIFNATGIANIADNASASPLTNLPVALHSAFPGLAGDQTTNEIAYTGYGRVNVSRSTGWTVTGNSVSPAAAIPFGACTAGSATASFFSVGVNASGASKILRMGVIGSRLGPCTAATSDTIQIPGLTGLAVNDRITFLAVDGSALPAGITEGVVYFVLTVSGDAVTVSTTQGGATLDITATGDALAYRVTPINISAGVTPQLTTATAITEE